VTSRKYGGTEVSTPWGGKGWRGTENVDLKTDNTTPLFQLTEEEKDKERSTTAQKASAVGRSKNQPRGGGVGNNRGRKDTSSNKKLGKGGPKAAHASRLERDVDGAGSRRVARPKNTREKKLGGETLERKNRKT